MKLQLMAVAATAYIVKVFLHYLAYRSIRANCYRKDGKLRTRKEPREVYDFYVSETISKWIIRPSEATTQRVYDAALIAAYSVDIS